MADPTNQPKTPMTFTGPVYGVAGTVEGDQIIQASSPNLEPAIAELHQATLISSSECNPISSNECTLNRP